MHVLIAVSSKHGSTRGIADGIAEELHNQGLTAEVADIAAMPVVAGHDAVIVGSAVYMGHWLPEARAFVEHNQAQLTRVPVWLFSSGPLGDEQPKPEGDPAQLAELLESSGARGHQIFVGKLDATELGFKERLAVKLVKAPYGDFRDWAAIRGWARDIAAELRPASVVASS